MGVAKLTGCFTAQAISMTEKSSTTAETKPDNSLPAAPTDLSPELPIWNIRIAPAGHEPDRAALSILSDARDLGLIQPAAGEPEIQLHCSKGLLIQGDLEPQAVARIAGELLTEPVVEQYQINRLRSADPAAREEKPPPAASGTTVFVLPQPGVTDAEADSALAAIQLMGFPAVATRTYRQYEFQNLDTAAVQSLAHQLLANDSIEQIRFDHLEIPTLLVDQAYEFQLRHVPLIQADSEALQAINATRLLSLTPAEMQTIQQHFQSLNREPTDVELETIAQTWSEHCSHKTLAGRIRYTDDQGTRQFQNMLKETIFAATQQIRQQLGDKDWCVSVFEDNAGIIRFNDSHNLTFKVETHNRPSAIEPYGGAATGIGGVIRDTLGTGMGAKPICNTDVFCFANPRTPPQQLPPGILHPRRVMKGVVAGVRDYGNRMGIPTVNGAVCFDQRYLGNPLVFCGNVGLLPQEHSFKQPQPHDWIVTVGGRTGRDGIKGATFSSAELTESSEQTSSGAVQIGNPIVEKMLVDVLLQARDRGLYNAITDCGAGGFSSAVGEMGEKIGAEVWLEKAPLKYQGLSYTEIWISEAQERMVCSVPDDQWDEFQKLCWSEGVEATIIGQFVPTGKLKLMFQNQLVGELEMSFLHDGRPDIVRDAVYQPRPVTQFPSVSATHLEEDLLQILANPNVASKHWIIRQYDHEVLGQSVLKPLVGVGNGGPGDAAVIRPLLTDNRAVAVANGINPQFGDLDPFHMAASAIDEAVRNCVAVGADPDRIAILDNFCWGYTDRPETLGSLVRAALGCQQTAIAMETPFISGKDSLNNEFSYRDSAGNRKTLAIPPTLLISALGQIDDARHCVTMDFKQTDRLIYQVGVTRNELGGSHFGRLRGLDAGHVPRVDPTRAKSIFQSLHQAIRQGLVAACHDLSEGGLATALAEMSIAGNLGAEIDIAALAIEFDEPPSNARQTTDMFQIIALFAESNSRFLVEVASEHQKAFEALLPSDQRTLLGKTIDSDSVRIRNGDETVLQASIVDLRNAWQQTLDWGGTGATSIEPSTS